MERVRDKKVLIIIVAAVVVVAGIIVAIVLNLPKKYDNLSITNSEAIKEVNRDQMYEFKEKLYNMLLEKKLIEEGTTIDDVTVREDSVVSYTKYDNDKNKIKTTTFLVDIDSIKQTYRVKIIDTDVELTDLAVQITCPLVADMKYKDSVCEGLYGSSSKQAQNNLPYEATMPSGHKVYVKSLEPTMGGSKLLHIYLYSCDEKNPPITETKDFVHEWVKKLGDENVEFYTYDVRTGYCEGDTI